MRRLGAPAALLALAACGADDVRSASEAGVGAGSSTIVRTATGIWLTSPDDDQVVLLDAGDLSVVESVKVEGAPEQLAPWGEQVVVTLAQAAEVALVGGEPGTERVETGCGGTGAVAVRGDTAWVACPHDDQVVEIDLVERRVTRRHEATGRPTALFVDDAGAQVGLSRGGEFLSLPDGGRRPLETDGPGRSAVRLHGLAGGGVGIWQQVDHDGDRERPPEQGGYGTVFDERPRIEPRLTGPCGERYARYDGGPRVFSGAAAVASVRGVVWIAHEWTDNVAVLRCGVEDDGLVELIATFEVGRGPRGITVSNDGRTAWVDVGFDAAVALLELPDPDVTDAALSPTHTVRRELLGDRWSPEARRGRGLFHDAVNTHLTPSGVVTCAACHPAGGEDGLSWFLHTETVPRKVRRTPAAWNAKPALHPLHWDGEFDDAGVLTRGTIVGLMDGDGLLVDTAAVGAYMAELPSPPGAPIDDETHAAGGAVFEAAGCGDCHGGAYLSDSRAHSVLPASDDPDARMAEVVTPSLLGVRAHPPYFHDGRAATLMDVLTTHNPDDRHGVTSGLTADERENLLGFLRSL